MKLLEFGQTNAKKLLLIHGFQSPWQVWEPYIEHFRQDYHVIVPIITGHDPETEEDFDSFAADAAAIEDYILGRYGQHLDAVFAMSMGGVLAATLWQNQRLHFDKVIFDGSPLVKGIPLLNGFIRSFYLNVTHKTQQRDPKTLKQATAICPRQHFDAFLHLLDHMSDATILRCLQGIASFQLKPDIPSADTTAYFFHGTAMNELLAKQAAGYLKKHYPSTVVTCFKGKAHCENSLFHPEKMIAELERIL